MIDNSNILSEGLKASNDTGLKFWSNKINRTNILPIELTPGVLTETSTEIICPDGSFRYEIYITTEAGFVGTGEVQIIINGFTYQINNYVGGANKFLLFEKKGQPYVLVRDTIQLVNKLGVACTFYLFFDRIMFDNE